MKNLCARAGFALKTGGGTKEALELDHRRNHPRCQLGIAPFIGLGAPENRASADKVDVPPIELDRFGHTRPGA